MTYKKTVLPSKTVQLNNLFYYKKMNGQYQKGQHYQ